MKKLCVLGLSCLAVVAVLAISAAPASATDTVQVVNEDTGTTCGGTVSTACDVVLAGTITYRVDLVFFEINEATCSWKTFWKVLNTAIVIWALVQRFGGDANCSTVVAECNLPWNGNGEEDGAVGVVQSNVSLCLDPSESDTNCQGNLAFNLVEQAGEHYDTNFNNATVGICELDVDLEVTGEGDTIHINHP